jgi:Acetyltransferase (GNAT) domain
MPQTTTWQQICDDPTQDVPVFMQPWWLDIVCVGRANWQVVLAYDAKNRPISAQVFWNAKLGKIIPSTIPPILSPMSGLWVAAPIKHKTDAEHFRLAVEAIIPLLPHSSWLEMRWKPEDSDWTPLSWKGFKQTTRYTYRLDLSSSQEALFDHCKKDLRRHLRQASEVLSVEIRSNPEGLFPLVEQIYREQGVIVPFSKTLFESLVLKSHELGLGTLLVAKDENGLVLGFNWMLISQGKAYFLVAGTDLRYRKSGAVIWLIWQSILEAKKLGCQFVDFEGSMIPGVEFVLRTFGAVQTPYFYLFRTKGFVANMYRFLKNKW